MCGIFGVVGIENAGAEVLEGLKRLEYRGYDSFGITQLKDKKMNTQKRTGAVSENVDSFDFEESVSKAIGHTRWATHGGVTQKNAHPHASTDGSFVLAQNGIVENFTELKKELKNDGFSFKTETDTEVIVRLIEKQLETENDLLQATKEAFKKLGGRNTIIVLATDGTLIAIRNGSPLLIGKTKNGYIVSSDALSFAHKTNEVCFLNDLEGVCIKEKSFSLFNLKTNSEFSRDFEKIKNDDFKIDKEGFDHFMLKEIHEQTQSIKNPLSIEDSRLKKVLKILSNAESIYTLGAGTAWHEASLAAHLLRKNGKKAFDLKAYECRDYKSIFNKNDVVVAFSQSGETADTIEAIEFAKEKGAKIVSIVNVIGSTIDRISDISVYAKAGSEIGVASTKAFTSKISLAYFLSESLNRSSIEVKKELTQAADATKLYFSESYIKTIKKLVKKLKSKSHFFVLGKGKNYSIAMESALKVKEISYKHFEGFSAGELKHGVIALIEKGTPVFSVISEDENKADMINATMEVKARGAFCIGIAPFNHESFDVWLEIPNGSASVVSAVIPMQLFAYYLSIELGLNPDKPRNLAKSVTVK